VRFNLRFLLIFQGLFALALCWSVDCLPVLKQISTSPKFHNGHLSVVRNIVSALNNEEILSGVEFSELTKIWDELKNRSNKKFKKQKRILILTQNQRKSLEIGRQEGSKTLKNGIKISDRDKLFEMDAKTAQVSWKYADDKVLEFLKSEQEIDFASLVSINNILRRGEPQVTDYAYRSVFMVRPGKPGIVHGDGEAALRDVIEWYNLNKNKLHPIVLATLTAQRLVSYHPFAEANGRSSRLLLDWILMKNGFPPASWSEIDYNNFVLEVNSKMAIQNTTQAVKRTLDILDLKKSK
jgi:hypothetical protein